MCVDLHSLRDAIVTYAAGFDTSLLSCAQAGEAMLLCAEMEASLASLKSLAAARAAEAGSWRNDGYRSAVDELARKTRTSPSAARRTLETGRRLSEQPEVAKAALSGELSPEQQAIIAEGAEANPEKAQQLIDKARTSSLGELNAEVARIKAAASDPEARRKAIRARRFFRRWSDRDGALQAHLYGEIQDGASMWRMLDPIRRRLAVLREQGEVRDNFEALAYDALVAMAEIAAGKEGELGLLDLLELGLFPQLDPELLACREGRARDAQPDGSGPVSESSGREYRAATSNAVSIPDLLSLLEEDPGEPQTLCPRELDRSPTASSPAPPPVGRGPVARPDAPEAPLTGRSSPKRRGRKLAGSPVQVMIRVDLDTLLRGVAIEGELCEIAGYGPVPVSVIEELVANDNAFVVGVLTKSSQVLGVYRRRRRPNVAQVSALQFLYPTCAASGCGQRTGLQNDHREDWARIKVTVFDLCDRLCPHHHRLKTNHGWGLVEGSGKRAFVAPEDPRHPGRVTRATTSPDPPMQSCIDDDRGADQR